MQGRKGILALAGGLLVMLSGCVGLLEPRLRLTSAVPESAPSAAALGSSLFYPLDIGNHWNYARSLTLQITPTGGAPEPPVEIGSSMDVDLVGSEQRFGRDYVVQLEVVHDPSGTIESRFLYRQDKSGLFNADPEPTAGARIAWTASSPSVARSLDALPRSVRGAYQLAVARLMEKQAAIRDMALHASFPWADFAPTTAGPLTGEIALLRYPLATSKTWHVREDPLVIYTVEGQEPLALAAGSFNGWRIRIDWPGVFGPNDRAHVWYGRAGLLQLVAHVESTVTDENGNVIGTAVSDETQILSGLSLVARAGS